MKSIIHSFKNMQAFSVLVGMACGALVGLILFCYLVPGGSRAISMYRFHGYSKQEMMNKEELAKMGGAKTMPAMHHQMGEQSNPYMMDTVTSEKQFLSDMVTHHEAAVMMAKQVLAIPTLHQETRDLAAKIITAQNGEIKMMNTWLSLWGQK